MVFSFWEFAFVKHALKSYDIVFLQTLIYFNCSLNRLMPMSAEEGSLKSRLGSWSKILWNFPMTSLSSLAFLLFMERDGKIESKLHEDLPLEIFEPSPRSKGYLFQCGQLSSKDRTFALNDFERVG